VSNNTDKSLLEPIGNYAFNPGIKSLRATLPDESFYWGLCFLNRAFRKYMREKLTNEKLFIQFINYVW
jgi:hypothetical protein